METFLISKRNSLFTNSHKWRLLQYCRQPWVYLDFFFPLTFAFRNNSLSWRSKVPPYRRCTSRDPSDSRCLVLPGHRRGPRRCSRRACSGRMAPGCSEGAGSTNTDRSDSSWHRSLRSGFFLKKQPKPHWGTRLETVTNGNFCSGNVCLGHFAFVVFQMKGKERQEKKRAWQIYPSSTTIL